MTRIRQDSNVSFFEAFYFAGLELLVNYRYPLKGSELVKTPFKCKCKCVIEY